MKNNTLEIKKVKKINIIKSMIFLILILLFIFLYFNINNKSVNINNNKNNLKISDYDNIYMPDQNLKNELLKLLKDKAYRDEQRVELTDPNYVKSSYETEITKREAEMFKIIGVNYEGEADSKARYPLANKQISDLTGLEYFINLRNLRLQDNLIENLSPIKNLNRLYSLGLGNNKIKDITPLAELTNLSYLFINNNQITDISALSKLVNMERLFIYNNQIKEISSLSKMTQIKDLDIERNQITDISPLSGLINLEKLNVNKNQIKEINSLSTMTKMRELYLNDNEISNISSLSRLINLEKLEANNNQIKEINSLSKMTKMRCLDLENNEITNISALSELVNLNYLDLWNNKIKEINSLIKMTKMVRLDIGNNEIIDISALSGLINLESLVIGSNQIKEINSLSKMTKMKTLYIYSNQITDVSPLSRLINLELLSADFNQIKEISSLSKMTKIKELWISNNQIKDISPLSELVNLEELEIDDNQITDISTLKNKNKLNEFWASGNKIADFSPLKEIKNNLERIRLNSQKLEYRPTKKELDITLKDENGNDVIIPDSEYLKRKSSGKYEILKEPDGEYIELKVSPHWNVYTGYIRIYTDKLNFYTPQTEKMYVRKANSNYSYLGGDLEYNSAITNLPSGAKVTVLKDIDKNIVGNQKVRVKITLADGKENIVDIDVEVLDNLSFNIFLKGKDGKALNILEEFKAEYKTKNILSKDKNISGKYSGVIFENGTYKLTFDGNKVPKGYKGLNEYTLTYEGNPNVGEKLILKSDGKVVSEKTIYKGGKSYSPNDFNIILEKILELPKAGSKENLKIYTIVAINLMLSMLAFKKRRKIQLFIEKRFMR